MRFLDPSIDNDSAVRRSAGLREVRKLFPGITTGGFSPWNAAMSGMQPGQLAQILASQQADATRQDQIAAEQQSRTQAQILAVQNAIAQQRQRQAEQAMRAQMHERELQSREDIAAGNQEIQQKWWEQKGAKQKARTQADEMREKRLGEGDRRKAIEFQIKNATTRLRDILRKPEHERTPEENAQISQLQATISRLTKGLVQPSSERGGEARGVTPEQAQAANEFAAKNIAAGSKGWHKELKKSANNPRKARQALINIFLREKYGLLPG